MTSWRTHVQHPKRQHALKIRAEVESGIREFFLKDSFIETRTPILVPSPGMETHIRPFRAQPHSSKKQPPAYLQTSPEFAMKKLLAGGLSKIFQLAPCFRSEPYSPHHRTEFLMLEWYRAYEGYERIMKDTEDLVEFLARKIYNKAELTFENRKISVKTPWPRFSTRDLFAKHLSLDLGDCTDRKPLEKALRSHGLPFSKKDTWDDLYFKLWLNFVEPRLPKDRPSIVYHYPPSQSALAQVEMLGDGTKWAKRFEFYIAGLELGNAFEELTDPLEQRKRFKNDMALRKKIYKSEFPPSPIDEDFMRALKEGLPPCSGIAVGVDRLVMLLANESDIQYTRWI